MTRETQPIKFNGEESFVLDLFVKAHNSKSWVAVKENANRVYMSATATGKQVKKIEITKTSDSAFDVEIMSGVSVRCHMHWMGTLTNLLRRMEAELLNPELQEA